MSSAGGAGELYYFDATGRHVRTVGRQGAGPGELRQVSAVFAGDRLYVADGGNRRIVALDPTGETLMTWPLEPGESLVASSTTEGLILRRPSSTQGTEVVRLRNGERSPYLAGDSTRDPAEEVPFANFTPAADGGVWVTGLRSYTVRRYSPDGVEVSRFSFQPTWFGVTPRNAARYSDWLDSRSAVNGISEDPEAGVVWVKIGVPEAEYPILESDPTRLNVATLDLFVDEVVEAVDRTTGRILAHRRFPYMGKTLLPNGYAWLHGERADGEPQIIIVRLRVD